MEICSIHVLEVNSVLPTFLLCLPESIFFPREPENTQMDFKDAINHGIKLAVEENNPHVKLMPVGKLRKFDRVYNYDHHPLKQKNSNFRLVLLRIFIDLVQNFVKA